MMSVKSYITFVNVWFMKLQKNNVLLYRGQSTLKLLYFLIDFNTTFLLPRHDQRLDNLFK
jgi:hypothetical protein